MTAATQARPGDQAPADAILASLTNAVAAGDPVDVEKLFHDLDRDQLRDLVVRLVAQLEATAPVPINAEHGPERLCAQATQLAAAAFGVSVDAVISRDRHRPVTDARAVAQTVARNCGLTLPSVGSYFGQHHTAVMYAIKKVADTPRLAAAAAQIAEHIKVPNIEGAAA